MSRDPFLQIALLSVFLFLSTPAWCDRLSVENDTWVVDISELQNRDPNTGELPIHFNVRRKGDGAASSITTRGRFLKVTEIVVTPENLLLTIGTLRYGGDIVTISDLNSGKQLGSLWAYGFSLSPDKKWLVYTTHYPRLGPSGSKSSVIALLPLERDWLMNHGTPEGFRKNKPGIPAFPQINAEEGSFDIMREPGHMRTSPFLWTVDSSAVLFLDFYQEQNRLVELTVPEALGQIPFMASRPLDYQKYLNVEPNEGKRFMVAKAVRWNDRGAVVVEGAFPEYWYVPVVQFERPRG